ncbi:MAG: hypothetical protein ACRDYU_15050 [Actinomycetes bacterium]
MTQTRKWVAAAAVLSVLVLLAGWFLLVGPKQAEADAIQAQAQQQQDGVEMLRAQLEVLQGQSEGLAEQRELLTEATAALPDDPRLPDLVRSLTKIASKSDSDLVSIAPGKPVDLVAPVAPVATGTTPAPDATSATPAAPGVPALKTVPLTLEVSGEYIAVERFLHLLEQVDRPILVDGFTLSVGGAEAAGTTAAAAPTSTATTSAETADGDVTLAITGRTFMVDRSGATGATATGVTPATGTTSGSETP